MPLNINVGLSRKTSENYQSRGASINLIAELDHSLLGRPDELQREIDGLYHQAEIALQRQEDSRQPPTGNHAPPPAENRNHRTGADNNPSRNSRSPRNTSAQPRPATASQLRALGAIASRLDIDLEQRVHDEFGCPSNGMTIRQASELIDHLKAKQSSAPPADRSSRRGAAR